MVIEGFAGLKFALNKLAPDIKKQLDKEVREALKPIISDARSKVPSSAPGGLYNYNYPGYERKPAKSTGKTQAFPSYDPRIIRKGLTYSLSTGRMKNTGFVSLFALLNKSRSGAIIETAGRKNPNGSPQSKSNNPRAGERFISGVNGVGALKDYSGRGRMSTGRLLYAAYARNEGRALNAVLISIEKAKAEFIRRVQSKNRAAA